MDETVEIIQEPQKLSLFQQEKAAIDIQVATARQFPRNIRRSVDNAIATVQLTEKVAETCMYSVPRGRGKVITGPSIHMAKIIAQTWGNLRMSNKVIDIDLKHVTSQAMCWDLEANIAIQTEVKRLIIGREGRYSDDMITVTGNAANAISLRNAILAVIPEAVTERVYTAAIERITGKLSDTNQLTAKRIELITGFRELYQVTEQEILYILGKTAVENITKEDIAVLIGIKGGLRDGDTTVDEAFKRKKVQEKNSTSAKLDRIIALINDSKTIEELEKYKKHINSPEIAKLYDERYAELLTKQ